ncbi:hypothetical protein KSP39_PZI012253 [Platanthera zijinensis]|uniref:Uncharacterized protein n=1 Tax=Platanthera zijinensis TaxID=2320716 RepID=A0AAP0G5B7_9ASPA
MAKIPLRVTHLGCHNTRRCRINCSRRIIHEKRSAGANNINHHRADNNDAESDNKRQAQDMSGAGAVGAGATCEEEAGLASVAGETMPISSSKVVMRAHVLAYLEIRARKEEGGYLRSVCVLFQV